jgi:WD40 repeat protein
LLNVAIDLPEEFRQDVFLSPQADLIGGFDSNARFKVYDTRDGNEKFSADNGYRSGVLQPAISPDGKLLVYQDRDGIVRVIDLATGKEKSSFAHPEGKKPGPMLIASDNRTLYLGSESGRVFRWDLTDNRKLADIGPHSSWTLNGLVLSPDEKTLYTTGWDGLIRRWDVATGKELPAPEGYQTRTTVFPDRDEKTILVADHGGRLDRWDLKTGGRIESLDRKRLDGFTCLAQSADRRWLAAGCTTQKVKLWDTRKGWDAPTVIPLVEADEKKGDIDHVGSVQFSPDGKLLYCISARAGLVAREVPSGQTVWNVPLAGNFFVLDGTGDRIVSTQVGFQRGPIDIHVLDAKTGKPIHRIDVADSQPPSRGRGTQWIWDFASVPGSSRLLSLHGDGTMRIFDLLTGKEEKRFALADPLGGSAVAISADGRWVACAKAEQQISIRELDSGKEMFSMGTHDSAITQLAFSRDGKQLVSSADLSPILWDLKPRDLPQLGGVEEVWKLLASDNAGQVYRLQWSLTEDGRRAREILTARIKSEDWVYDRKRHDRLVEDLDSPRFAEREAAEKELTEREKTKLDWLRESAKKIESEEAKVRMRRVIESREGEAQSRKEWRIGRCVQVLERIGDAESRAILKLWSSASEGSLLADLSRDALGRLERR